MKFQLVVSLICIFLSGSQAHAMNLVQSDSMPAKGGNKNTVCDIFNMVNVPSTQAAAVCDERTKNTQKRAWNWLTQALGGGIQSKSCEHFQKRFEKVGADLRKALAFCRDQNSVGSKTIGVMLVRDIQAQEVKDSAGEHLENCVFQLESVRVAANNQTLLKSKASKPFSDPFTAADLEQQVRRDLAQIQRMQGTPYKDAQLKSHCDAVLKDSIGAIDRIRGKYGEMGVVRIFREAYDRASMEKASALAAQNALSNISKPQPLKNSDPRWAR